MALLAVPATVALLDRITVGSDAPGLKPDLLLLTGLPLVWGDGGIKATLDGTAASAASHVELTRAFAVKPIDAVTPPILAPARLLMVAQPRPPGAEALVALDDWVRAGGRTLMLTDPALRWPSDLPPGDPRRPPALDGLAPLLAHWGLALDPPGEREAGIVERDAHLAGQRHRIITAAPGRFRRIGPGCMLGGGGLIADCRLGRGRAILIADADLLHDLLWSEERADNAAFVRDALDRLASKPDRGGTRIEHLD